LAPAFFSLSHYRYTGTDLPDIRPDIWQIYSGIWPDYPVHPYFLYILCLIFSLLAAFSPHFSLFFLAPWIRIQADIECGSKCESGSETLNTKNKNSSGHGNVFGDVKKCID
jgi:hypothetical protein